jgi:hypothetical protein
MHGPGIHYLSNKAIYYGQFENNKKNGFGALELINGDRYEGEFKDDAI